MIEEVSPRERLRQSFQNVTPSQPHTSACVLSQKGGKTWHTPVGSPHAARSQ